MSKKIHSSDRFQTALSLFEAAHQEDPRRVETEGGSIPWSLHYHRRLDHWVRELAVNPAEDLLLAARCQHLRRWKIPRDDFPKDRAGYHRWRKKLMRFHAEQAGQILAEAGYAAETISRVQELVQKRRIKLDEEVQVFEDAICMVFLENELQAFQEKHPLEKVQSILRKTWEKMSEKGRKAALEYVSKMPGPTRRLVQQALS